MELEESLGLLINEEETIKMYRAQGKTIKEIADMFGCSTGLIHKVISEENDKQIKGRVVYHIEKIYFSKDSEYRVETMIKLLEIRCKMVQEF